ncbi:2542_t:CDS:2 [Cetraspora pellucida]|uniref:2542_t:CDS:1 n=1 Tax=Cetraspora pellucida TaxID=1433469 RepID=A0A9N9JQ64_9GLOM|nr:2542_t:CDS:2 [Cetraspora pellucida]
MIQEIDTDKKAKYSLYNNTNKDLINNDTNKESINNDVNKDSINNDANNDSIYNSANNDSIYNNVNNDLNYNDTNGKIHDEEKNIEKKAKDNDVIEMILAAVSTNDDPALPCLTFRYWVLSTVSLSLGSAISVFYYFRANSLTYSIFFVILASYIAGKWLEKILPNRIFHIRNWEFNLNPGPFNYKEHVCITAAATAGGLSAYAVDIIAIQDLYYNTQVNFLTGFLLLISTQMIGYGLVGFVRKHLVRPINMIWPQSLIFASMYNTLHGNISETNDRTRFFYTTFFAMFAWQFVPGYIFPWLISAALLCLIAPNNNVAKILGSSHSGAGILSLSFDWNAIGQFSPLFTPWWSQVNFYIGVVLAIWVIAPLLYFNHVFDAQKFPFSSSRSFDKDGNIYDQRSIIDPQTGALNVTAYESYSPVYMSAAFAACYGYNFLQIPATVCHVILYHGKEIWNRYKKTREEEEKDDIHCKLMSVYPG